jgi:hypothetical protein
MYLISNCVISLCDQELRCQKINYRFHLIGKTLMFDAHSDVLRYASHTTRTSTVQSPRSRTAPPRFQRHGLSILFFGQKFRSHRGNLLWDRMLYRRVPGKIRSTEFRRSRLYNGRSSCIQSWTASNCIGLRRIRSFFGRYRLLYADAG